jgi:hypothetical protein
MNLPKFARWSGLAAALFQAACATPPRTMSFDEGRETALLVTASPPTTLATIIEFRRVDLESRTFQSEIISIENAAINGTQINPKSAIWISLKSAKPGDYAIVSLTTNTLNGFGPGQAWGCLYSGAPVYRISRGKISIVPVKELWVGAPSGIGGENPTSAAILDVFEIARQDYPNISGPAMTVEPVALIHWNKTRGIGMTRNCSEPTDFVIDRRGDLPASN